MGSDEEDIEFLRLAALKSRKQKLQTEQNREEGNSQDFLFSKVQKNTGVRKSYKNRSHSSRGFQVSLGRGQRNIAVGRNSRVNSNLISIPIVNDESISNNCSKKSLQSFVHKKHTDQNSVKEGTENTRVCDSKPSKFTRYEHSDNSDSETGSEKGSVISKTESIKCSERGHSLDRLMDELENEIAGSSMLQSKNENYKQNLILDVQDKEKKTQNLNDMNDEAKTIEFDVIIKEEPKSREPSPIVIDNDRDEEPTLHHITSNELIVQNIEPLSLNISNDSEKLLQSPTNDMRQIPKQCSPEKNTVEHSRSPLEQFERNHMKSPFNFKSNRNRSRSPQKDFFYNKYFNDNSLSPRCRLSSPLGINTEVLNTITMAPLSPRSAAFVLQNREILAKRKMSPRRSTSRSTEFSVSRSPTPRRRSLSRDRQLRNRSLSPRRSAVSPSTRGYYSPKRSQPRSVSPKNRNASPLRRRSRSVSRNRFYSGKKRSPGHLNISRKKITRYSSPKRKSRSPVKKSVHSRLGFRVNTSKTIDKVRTVNRTRRKSHSDHSLSLSLSPSPEHTSSTKDESHGTNSLIKQKDSILEARKRKFENNIPIESAGGVIKLKLKSSNNEFENNQLNDEIISTKPSNESLNESDSEFIDMNPTVDDLWSTEESESENEGRFKVSKLTDEIGNDTHKSKLSSNVDKIKFNRNTNESQKMSNRTFMKHISANKSKKFDKNSKNKSRSPFSNRYKMDKVDDSSCDKKEKLDKRESRSSKIISEIKCPQKSSSERSYGNVIHSEKDQLKSGFGNRNISVDVKTKNDTQNADENDKIQIEQNDNKLDENNVSKVTICKDASPVLEKNVIRKVTEIPVKSVDSNEPEIIYEDEDEKNDEEGDLRAELSRRRAQRRAVNVVSVNTAHGPPTRILQNAFQEMSKKRPIQLSNVSRPNKVSKHEVKLPVRLRLGLPEDELQIPKEESFLNSYYKEINTNINEELIHISPTERKRNHVRGNRKKRINLQV